MFRTRLAALVVAGSLSFSSGCAGLCNMFCSSPGAPCCSGPSAAPCCGNEFVGSSPVSEGPIMVPQSGGPPMTDPGTVLVTPTPTPPRMQPIPQSVPVPALPSSIRR